jgi:hypothetical protein
MGSWKRYLTRPATILFTGADSMASMPLSTLSYDQIIKVDEAWRYEPAYELLAQKEGKGKEKMGASEKPVGVVGARADVRVREEAGSGGQISWLTRRG